MFDSGGQSLICLHINPFSVLELPFFNPYLQTVAAQFTTVDFNFNLKQIIRAALHFYPLGHNDAPALIFNFLGHEAQLVQRTLPQIMINAAFCRRNRIFFFGKRIK